MKEAIIGFIGVLVGSGVSWLQAYWTESRATKKNARYLAIRVVCILDKYLEDCVDTIKDPRRMFIPPMTEGRLVPQVKNPGPPVFPEDVDWKSIDHDLMYQILSLPSEVEGGERMIKATEELVPSQGFDAWFDERDYHYSRFALMAFNLSEDLCEKYGVKRKAYNNWNPAAELKQMVELATERRNNRMRSYEQQMNAIFNYHARNEKGTNI